jgi:hypothetical protein
MIAAAATDFDPGEETPGEAAAGSATATVGGGPASRAERFTRT